ncbi:serine/threonine-protein kinase [Streptomyces sp. NPDC006430]|uniref:serine/threonine-protein kinase n=1 Tax=Streptomyces sp. NPDC006430 TaxID=3154299 RepID=UPI0033B68356
MTAGEANGAELVGRVLGGRYRVTSLIGRGGMGVVGRAVDELLGREVAVKIMRAYTDASGAELADLRTRMQREAQAAARIRHPGVVTVHDVTEEQGLPVIVMELVDGPSLDDVLAEHGPIEAREAAAIGAKLMDALDAAHRAGVLHRDVKPANVLLERDGRVVLTDFGIATLESSGDEAVAKLTRSGELIGSLDYLPPERAQGKEPGPASDIWSLGMTLYAAVEGTSPFRRTSAWSTLSAIVAEPLPPCRRAGPLAPVLQALMAKEPEDRPDAARAREMLESVAAERTVHQAPAAAPPTSAPVAVPPPPYGYGPAPTPYPHPAPAPAAYPGHPAPGLPSTAPHTGPSAAGHGFGQGGPGGVRPRRRSSRTVIAAAVAVVLAGGGIAYATVGGRGDKSGGQAHAKQPQAAAPKPSSTEGPRRKPSGTPGKGSATPSTKPSGTAGGTATAAPASPATKPSPVPTGCTGWAHQERSPGGYGYMSGSYHMVTGPYQSCPAVALVKSGTKVSYHCYVVNAYGHKWTFVRTANPDASGWMSNDNLTRQSGPSNRC